MGTTETKPKVHGLPKNRLETLVDGVFAIAMTLLVLELRVPEGTGSDLAAQLAALWPRFATFFISFLVLGVYWFAHHQVTHLILVVNRTLVWLNILFLAGVALIPFAASLLGTHPTDPVALAVYGAVLGLIAAEGYLIWWYVNAYPGLVVPGLDPYLVRKVRIWLASGPLISLVAIGLAFVSPTITLLIFLALPVVFVVFNPVSRYLERLDEEEESRAIEPPSRT